MYSRKVVGFALRDTLEARWALEMLQITIDQSIRALRGLIHHSDRGVQYFRGGYMPDGVQLSGGIHLLVNMVKSK